MKSNIKQSNKRSAFTIVELLTVMSIIVILIGLLVPALNNVRKYAREVRQRAQFHSVGVALEQFNSQFHCQLAYKDALTLNDLITMILDRHPSVGDIVRIDQFEMVVLEVSLSGVKTVLVKTVI